MPVNIQVDINGNKTFLIHNSVRLREINIIIIVFEKNNTKGKSWTHRKLRK